MRLFTDIRKTYASIKNAELAVAKAGFENERYIIAADNTGRYFPVFIGQTAISLGIHFEFCVAS